MERIQNLHFPRNFVVLFLLGSLALGALLRLMNLDVSSIWIDELNHYYAATSYNETGEMTFPSGQPNARAKLYSVLVAYSFNMLGEGPVAVRLPSALLGIACIGIAFWVALRILGKHAAMISALFVAISPFALGWSRLSRMYTLYQALFMLAAYWFYLGFESQGKGRMAALQENLFKTIKLSGLAEWLKSLQLNIFWLLASAISLYLAYGVHETAALFVIGVILYSGVMVFAVPLIDGRFTLRFFKYLVVAGGLTFFLVVGYNFVPFIAEKIKFGLAFIPKWAEGTHFQNRKLYLEFLFDQYHFPMGILFVFGAIQIFVRKNKGGLYLLMLFTAYFLLFSLVFSYRHFQYLFAVYSIFTIIAAYAYSFFVEFEIINIRKYWEIKSGLIKKWLVPGILILSFFWLPLTHSVRFALRIPRSADGNYNGAQFMEEWREAGNYVKVHSQPEDIIVSSDALGTYHYAGRVDFDLNFADYDLSAEEGIINEKGNYFDLYSGAPYITTVAQMDSLTKSGQSVWLLYQAYKFNRATAFISPELKKYVLENYDKVLDTQNKTVVVYKSR
ncbi:MAG: hypothetical protein DWQ10_13610 [Calditrichaeota bacterium]|nr:MAG: hypothetical protein DWQ10_13610 [Calditrichota bacterium]